MQNFGANACEDCVSPSRNFSARNLLNLRRDCGEGLNAGDDDFKSANSSHNEEAWVRKSQVTLYKAGGGAYAGPGYCASGGAGGEIQELSFNNSQHF